MSHQPTGTEAVVAAFSLNRNLQHAKLEWRFNEKFTDPRWATAYVGAELLAQQERAAKRYEQQSTATRASIDEQTRQNAEHARVLQTTIQESSEAVRREMSNVAGAVQKTTDAVNGLASQVAHLAWLQAEQNTTLSHILETIREGRANECRQLVEQGERNFHAGFLTDAEERFRLALGFDNTDYVTHQNLGLTLVGLGRLDEALEHFRKALAFPPKNDRAAKGFFVSRAATHAARVLYAKEDYAGAELYFQKALEADGRTAKNWYDLAVTRAYQANETGAIDALAHAFSGDVMLAGAALADEELAPIRPAVEDLVIRHTARAMAQTVEKPAAALREAQQQVAAITKRIGVELSLGVDADQVVRDAKAKGTLPATHEAFATLRRARQDLFVRATDAVRKKRAEVDRERAEAVREVQDEQEEDRGEYQRERERLEKAQSKAANVGCVENALVGIGTAIVGALLGAVTVGVGGFFAGALIGFVLGFVVYAIRAWSAKWTAAADLERLIKERNGVYEESNERTEEINGDAAEYLKEIDACLAELQKISG
ncbi:MAG TPA: hypothetical protein VGJ81_12530 [Thermoanaerobaculia bacterium]|jgi:tetratricopeptide (TPR) repeat protein